MTPASGLSRAAAFVLLDLSETGGTAVLELDEPVLFAALERLSGSSPAAEPRDAADASGGGDVRLPGPVGARGASGPVGAPRPAGPPAGGSDDESDRGAGADGGASAPSGHRAVADGGAGVGWRPPGASGRAPRVRLQGPARGAGVHSCAGGPRGIREGPVLSGAHPAARRVAGGAVGGGCRRLRGCPPWRRVPPRPRASGDARLRADGRVHAPKDFR